MELRQLRYFVSLVEHGSVHGAARANFVTAPAVSVQLKDLEDEVGAKLFVKNGRSLHLTPAGEMFLVHARDILQRVNGLSLTMQRLHNNEVGTLRIGSIDAASVYVLPKIFRMYRQRYPGVDIEVMVADSTQLLDAIVRDALEVAIVTLPVSHDELDVVPLYKDPMVVVAHPRHALARRRSVDLATLVQSKLITYPHGSTTRQVIDQVFQHEGLALHAAMELSSPEAMKCLAQAGIGASILPVSMVRADIKRGSMRLLRVRGATFTRMLGLVKRKKMILSSNGRMFVTMLAERFSLAHRHNVQEWLKP